jgi:hypothetical protein
MECQPIPSQPEYWATDTGRIISVKRCKPRVLCLVLATTGYWQVTLSQNGKAFTMNVHQLMMEAFRGKRVGMEVGHLDGDRTNNTLRNLAYVSRAENQSHKRVHGTNNNGSAHGLSKLTEDSVIQIRNEHRKGRGVSNTHILAEKFGVCRSNILHIASRKTWDHV